GQRHAGGAPGGDQGQPRQGGAPGPGLGPGGAGPARPHHPRGRVMSSYSQSQAAAAASSETAGLLDQVIAATRPQDAKEAERSKSAFQQFLGQVVKPGQVVSKDVETNIKYWIAEIDKKLTGQPNQIIH